MPEAYSSLIPEINYFWAGFRQRPLNQERIEFYRRFLQGQNRVGLRTQQMNLERDWEYSQQIAERLKPLTETRKRMGQVLPPHILQEHDQYQSELLHYQRNLQVCLELVQEEFDRRQLPPVVPLHLGRI